jgi:enoyl-CoA hydratase/carnithine racemase
MAAEASDLGIAQHVLVAQEVLDEMRQMTPAVAADVARAIQSIGRVEGEPIQLAVAGLPPGVRHYAKVPEGSSKAPVVIYRTMVPSEGGQWRVTSLMERATYDAYRKAERSGLLDDDMVKALLVVGGILVAAYLLTRGSKGASG